MAIAAAVLFVIAAVPPADAGQGFVIGAVSRALSAAGEGKRLAVISAEQSAVAEGAGMAADPEVPLGEEPLFESFSVEDMEVVTGAADVTLSAAPSIRQGDEVRRTFTVGNAGPAPATELALTVTFPDDARFVSAVSSSGTCGVVLPAACGIGSLAPGESAVVTVTVASPSYPLSLHAVAAANEPDQDLSSNVVKESYSSEFFPLLPGYSWTYLIGSSEIKRTVLGRAETVNGTLARVVRTAGSGYRQYYSADAQGVFLHREYLPGVPIEGVGKVNISLTYVPPMKIAKGVIQPGVSYRTEGIIRTNRIRGYVFEFPYSAEFAAVPDTVTVPAGAFTTLRISGPVTIAGESATQTLHLAQDVGIVKMETVQPGAAPYAESLADSNILSHDLAVTAIAAPKIVTVKGSGTRTARVRVTIQNRSQHPEYVASAAVLKEMVSLSVESLGSCPNPVPLFVSPPRKFPLVLKPKQRYPVAFDVPFSCANDPAAGTKEAFHGDFRLKAEVFHEMLQGGADSHPDDDVCPRSVTPPFVVDPFPDGSIYDKGCGTAKPDGTFGGDVVVDVVVR